MPVKNMTSYLDLPQKVCNKCGLSKDTTCFYRDATKKSGFRGRCKVCERVYWLERYGERPEGYKKKFIKVVAEYNKKHPEKVIARWKSGNKYGHHLKGVCQVCGEDKKLEQHHKDYSQPLKVMFICRGCHSLIHHPI